MEKGKVDIELFIRAVERQELLWNLSSSNYKHLRKRDNAWQKVAAQFGISASECKRKWKSLRSSYSREMSKILKKSSQDELESNWKYSNQLDFLREHMKGRRQSSPFSNNTSLSETSDVPTSSYIIEEMFVEPVMSPLSGSGDEPPKSLKKVHMKDDETHPCLTSAIRSMREYLEQSQAVSTADLDEDELFFRSILKQLKRFPIKDKNRCKLQILSFVSEVENSLAGGSYIEEHKSGI